MFGSAFAASLIHFYKEIKSFLPSGSLNKIDETIARYEASMSSIHPISPSSFPNPFYHMSDTITTDDGKVIKRPKPIVDSQELYLMDAGVDNNIPFFPLLREGRDVDVILAMDLSADIQTATHFDRAESYIKRRGIKGLPAGSGWPKTKDNSEDKYPLGSCTIFDAETKEEVTTTSETKSIEKKQPVTLAYFPFILNTAYDSEFDPQEEEFCSTWNFVYTPEQVKKVTGLAEANWDDNLKKIRAVLKKTWERKRKERLKEEEKA
jgi:phospholipase A2